jgi:polysaccharide biosynthesis transport protein
MSMPDNNSQQTASVPAAPGQTGSTATQTSIFLPPMMQGMDQGPPLPSALNAAPNAVTLMRAFQRRWPLAIGAGLLAALLTALAVFFVMPPLYVASYTVKINSARQTMTALGDRTDDVDFSIFKGSQQALASSRPVIVRALETREGGRFIKDLGIVVNSGQPIEWLERAIKTEFHPKAPEYMTVKLGADQPEEVTLLVSALGKALIAENEGNQETEHNAQIEKTRKKAMDLQTEIGHKRTRLNDQIKAALGVDGFNQSKKIEQLNEAFRDTRKSLAEKRIEIAGLQERIDKLENRLKHPDAAVPASSIKDLLRQELGAEAYLKRVAAAESNYQDAIARVNGEVKNSFIQPYLREKEAAAKALADYQRSQLPALTQKWREKEAVEAALQLTKYRDELAALTVQEKQLDDNRQRLDSEILTYLPKNLPPAVVSLQNEIDSYDKALNDVLKQISLMRANTNQPRVTILQDAIMPNGKDASRQLKIAGAGSIGMFLLTVLGVSFLEFRSRKITSADEVKRGLGLNLIGLVPALPEKERTPGAQAKLDPYWQNQLMESVDTIRTMLLHSARSNNTRVIMVTSAVGGEGKTSLASQLAASLARAWKKTLLIDGDLRNPVAHKLFDVAQEPGFSEVLRGELTASEAVRSTPLSRLWVLSAGHWDSHAVQALAQDNVRNMLEELKQQYDFIVLDSCPVLPVADSLLLGQNVDGVLLTVMRDVSRSPAVYAAQQRLESLGIKVLGAVVIGAKNELGPLGYKYAHQARP